MENTQCVGSPEGSSASSASTTGTTDSTPGTSASGPAAVVPATDGSPTVTKKIKYTARIRRGLALVRMSVMVALSDDYATLSTLKERWTKAQEGDFNAALAWIEQEEDWDSVAPAWAAMTGPWRKGQKQGGGE